MTLQLNRGTLKKLTHESTEIRLRTLEQVEAKLLRAMAHNQTIDFKPGELCKRLIRWFGFQPLLAPLKVLQLLARLLRSPYSDRAVEQLGIRRFTREMGKVEQQLRGRPEELHMVEEIKQILREHGRRTDDVVEILETLSLSGTENEQESHTDDIHSAGRFIECPPIDYEMPWSKPTIADINSMKFLADVLVNPFTSCVEIQNALQHLQITMSDYPAEYMLQAPNIFLNLLRLYEMADEVKCPLEDVAATLLTFLDHLKARLKMRRNVLSYTTSRQNSQVLGNTQLKVDKALKLLLDYNIRQLQLFFYDNRRETADILEIILATLHIYEMQHLCVDQTQLQKLFHLNERLKDHCEQDDHFTLQRIQYLVVSLILHDMAAIIASRQPFRDAQVLLPMLRDYAIEVNFPQRHHFLKELLFRKDPELIENDNLLQRYDESFSTAVQLLRQPKCLKSAQVLEQSNSICMVVEKLQSLELVKILYAAITDCNPLYPANSTLRQHATDLLTQLLNLSHEPLKAYVYCKLASSIKRNFACLLEGEGFCVSIPNAKLLDVHIFGVPLTTSLLLQIVHAHFESSQEDVRKHCEEILTLLLKSQHLLGAHWLKFIELLLPILPLLLCSTFSNQLCQLLLKLYDPDAHNLPFTAVLQGNICFLFHSNAELRCEALTRLVYLLNSLENTTDYVPNIMEISDLIPSDLCLLQTPRKFEHIFTASVVFTDKGTLHSLLMLLETPDIDPLIRKTTLMQLNVMCQNWQLTKIFCEESAYYLVMQALENSMQKSSYADYTDAVIPAISILAKVLLHDAVLRQELASMPNIYVLLLRALFLYHNDIQVRQDASLCLFLLLFACYVVVLPPGSSAQVPRILSNLQLPCKCEMVSQLRRCSMQDTAFSSIFANSNEEQIYVRQLLATKCTDGHLKLNNSKCLEALKQLDICATLKPTQRDLRLLMATMPEQNLRRVLRSVANATDHQTLLQASTTLKMQLLMQHFEHMPQLPCELVEELYKLISKYVQAPPGNDADYMVYERLLELSTLCVRLGQQTFIAALYKTLHNDPQHACVSLLTNDTIPLRLYHKISQLLMHLLSSEEVFEASKCADQSAFYYHLFETFFEQANKLLGVRDLQRVRCLLNLLQITSSYYLNLSDATLFKYSKRLLHFSLTLKSFTQTGAQWHRDCLLINCQLYAQMEEPTEIYQLNVSLLKYLSGMCGHNDTQVRALSWCILAQVAHWRAADVSGIKLILEELSYLPGGIVACCLSTLLDTTEAVLVRQLAGHLFVELLQHSEEAELLLEQHVFFRVFHESLNNCICDAKLPRHFDFADCNINATSCEIVSCYTHICIKMLKLHGTQFISELCEKPVMFKLYELLKVPPVHDNPAYYAMCSDICHVYAMCCASNFLFLQRTVCRDNVLLARFYQLMDQPSAQEHQLAHVLQLLQALCKDANAFEQLCEKFQQAPEFIVRLCLRAFDVAHLGTRLQTCTLAMLSLFLIMTHKQQQVDTDGMQECAERKNFTQILEATVEIEVTNCAAEKARKAALANKQFRTLQSLVQKNLEALKSRSASRELTTKNGKCLQLEKNTSTDKEVVTLPTSSSNVGAVFIFMELYRLFLHLYPTNACKFEVAPNAAKQQVCETLGILLKFSQSAQETARDLKFFEKILNILQTFQEEFKSSCSTFVRRFGETRKMAVIKNVQLLLHILLNWYATPSAVISNERQALELTRVLIQVWPWQVHSGELKLLMLRVCVFLSEHSLVVCQQFSTLISSYTNSILQLVLKIVTYETTKVKAASSDNYSIVSTGLRVLINCCACAEGRVALIKNHALDICDGLHPFNPKSPKIKADLLQAWLQFWELFSRYSEGAAIRNLNSLCAVVNRTTPLCDTRLLSLKILRNMCFLPNNRMQLLASTDFIYTINEIVSQPLESKHPTQVYSFAEQMVACVAIWKLLSTGVKFVAMIRGSKMAKKLRVLREQLTAWDQEDTLRLKKHPHAQDLANVLDIILAICSNN